MNLKNQGVWGRIWLSGSGKGPVAGFVNTANVTLRSAEHKNFLSSITAVYINITNKINKNVSWCNNRYCNHLLCIRFVISQFTVDNVKCRHLICRKKSSFFRVVVALLARIIVRSVSNFRKQETEHYVTTYA